MNYSEHLMKTYDFLALFEDIKPRLAVQRLTSLYTIAQANHLQRCRTTGLKLATLAETLIPGPKEGLYISPKGARALIALYKEGKLPCHQTTKAPTIPQTASQYARSQEAVKQTVIESPIPAPQERTVDQLMALPASQLFRELNALFLKRYQRFTGKKVMDVCGTTVTKSVELVSEPDEASVCYDISFEWRNDGTLFSLSRIVQSKANKPHTAACAD
ncbi:MAG: hypothetical protein C9356_11860 [Oleiphilus sp.]|nr:MAG: hypothetical protein C9356_11860 [Oleiphilus sp.]